MTEFRDGMTYPWLEDREHPTTVVCRGGGPVIGYYTDGHFEEIGHVKDCSVFDPEPEISAPSAEDAQRVFGGETGWGSALVSLQANINASIDVLRVLFGEDPRPPLCEHVLPAMGTE